MTLIDRLLALICAFAYGLRRTKVGFFRARRMTVVGCLLLAAYGTYLGWLEGFALVRTLLIALLLAIVATILWADAQRYVIFRPRPTRMTADTRSLAPNEKLLVRGSGIFAVSDMERYLVEVPVVFWSTGLGEHVLAAKIRAWNLMGIGVPSGERGWWYAFVEPKRNVEIVPGELCFGTHLRPAVRMTQQIDKGFSTVYLSCDDREQLALLLKELRTKASTARDRSSHSIVS